MKQVRVRTDPRRKPAIQASRVNDRRHGFVAATTLFAALITGVTAGAYAGRAMIPKDGYAAFLAQAEELRAGAVLFVPVEGNICRQRLIDNETWRMADAGEIVCDEAVSWNASAPNQKYFVAVRVDAIRAGFRK